VTAPAPWWPPPPGSWAARASAAVEREALAVAQDPAADPEARRDARASLLRPTTAEVLRRYDAAIAALSSEERGALRRALRTILEIVGPDDPLVRLLGGGRTLERVAGAALEPRWSSAEHKPDD